MKKRIFAFLMSCCMILPTIAACEKKTQEQQPEKKDVICSFESVEEVTTLYGGDIFGKKLYSSEEKYVTDGKGCMYMEIDADFDYIARENIWLLDHTIEFIEPHLRFTSTKFDFSDVEGVYGFAIDVYNASEKDVPVELTMEGGVDGAGSYFDMGRQVALKDKQCTLYFTADVETMIYQGIDDLISVWFSFPYTEGEEQPIKLYVDNFRMLRDEAIAITSYACGGNTLCSFENTGVLKRITSSSFFVQKDFWAKREINYDTQFVTEGSSSLKLTRGYSNYITKGRIGKQAITLSNKNFFKGSAFDNYTADELKRIVIKLDVYNAAPTVESIEYFIGPRIKENICMFRVANVQPNTWTTLELSVAQVIQDTADWGGIAIDLRELFVNFAFHLNFWCNLSNSEITTYVDNLRYEFA